MKKVFLIIILFIFISIPVCAYPINRGVYQTMQAQSYRNNYNNQVYNRTMPYWQAQSNYSTRGRVYQNYSNYARYMNSVNQSSYNNRMYRSFR